MNIVKATSTDYNSVFDDIKVHLSRVGDLDLTDFFGDVTATRIASAITGTYMQNRSKLDSNKREAFIRSALRKESIEYLAISQTNYNPKRYIAPQHGEGHYIEFKTADTEPLPNLDKRVIATMKIDNIEYNVSVIKDFEQVSGAPSGESWFKGKAGVGEWRQKIIEVDANEGDLDLFHIFTIDEDKYVIDDSDSIEISVVIDASLVNGSLQGGVQYPQIPIPNLSELGLLDSDEIKNVVLITTNFFGGIDLNFGDSAIFGNGLLYTYNEEISSIYIVVNYFVTPGFVPNLNFNDITFDSNFLIEAPVIDTIMTNGSNEESADKIKTLAPAANLSQYKIITPEDMTTDFNRIPSVKTAYAVKDSQWSDWISGHYYYQGEVAKYEGYYYIFLAALFINPADPMWELAPPDNTTYWLKATDEMRKNNATLKLHALVAKNTQTWSSTKTYSVDDVVYYTDFYWKALNSNSNSAPTSTNTNWEKTTPQQWEPLTQAAWELDYYEKYNYDSRLGFLRVLVGDLTEIPQDITATIILNKISNPVSRSQAEIDTLVKYYMNQYWYSLGVKFDIGKLVRDIDAITEVSHCYFALPTSNKQLSADKYYAPGNIDITYKTIESSDDRFCS